MKSINDIKYLIAEDELTHAMRIILTRTKEVQCEHFNDAILLSMDLRSFEKTQIQGTLNWEETCRYKRIIAIRMIKLLDRLHYELI